MAGAEREKERNGGIEGVGEFDSSRASSFRRKFVLTFSLTRSLPLVLDDRERWIPPTSDDGCLRCDPELLGSWNVYSRVGSSILEVESPGELHVFSRFSRSDAELLLSSFSRRTRF